MPAISGDIKYIIYQSDNGFTIARLLVADGDEITILGNLQGIAVGCRIEISDYEIEHNSRYGQQYKVSEWQMPVPSTIDGARAFLASGLIRGIGSMLAHAVVNHLGANAIDMILDQGPEALRDIPGIGAKRAQKICAGVTEHYAVQGAIQELSPLGLTPNLIIKAYRHFGPDVASKIKHNPYCLTELWGIGFLRADAIALKLGIKLDAIIRIRAAVKHVLLMATNEGHCYLPLDDLLSRLGNLLSKTPVKDDVIDAAIGDMRRQDHGLVFAGGNNVYLAWLHRAENNAADAINGLLATHDQINVDAAIDSYNCSNITLSAEQRNAVRSFFANGLSILTGGPGTGKTQTIQAICDIADDLGYGNIALAAPTGRASRVMADMTGKDAGTLHRLLGLQPGGQPLFDADNPLPYGMIIVDEASMLDISLASYLFRAIAPGSKLLMVGDKHQLPPVGPGNVFADLLKANVPTVNLTKIYRQSAGSMIAINAHKVNAGQTPDFGNKSDDYFAIIKDVPEDVADMVRKSYLRLLDKGYAVQDIQVLSPMRKGIDGVNNLNNILQAAINPASRDKQEVIVGNTTYRVGDKVMQIRNNYDKQVFNGEVGIVSSIGTIIDDDGDDAGEGVTVNYNSNGGDIVYERHELDQLVLAYATTIHKSQGSEYPAVILALTSTHYIMLSRCIFYTAISRAKNLFVLVGSKKAVAIAVNNQRVDPRYTALSGMIISSNNHNVTALPAIGATVADALEIFGGGTVIDVSV